MISFIKGQDFSTSYYLALPHPSPVSKLDLRLKGRLRKRDNLLIGRGGGGAESYDGEKAWSSRNYSILSDSNSGYCANCGAMIRLRLIGNREARRAGSRGQGTVQRIYSSTKKKF
jgi:hypothetical protein